VVRARLGWPPSPTGTGTDRSTLLGPRVLTQFDQAVAQGHPKATGHLWRQVAYQALARRWGTRALLTFLVQSVAAACLLGVIILAQALAIYESLRQLFGGGFGGSVVAEMLLALIIFLLKVGAGVSRGSVMSFGLIGGVGLVTGRMLLQAPLQRAIDRGMLAAPSAQN